MQVSQHGISMRVPKHCIGADQPVVAKKLRKRDGAKGLNSLAYVVCHPSEDGRNAWQEASRMRLTEQ